MPILSKSGIMKKCHFNTKIVLLLALVYFRGPNRHAHFKVLKNQRGYPWKSKF